jgi:hypothetical protein
MSPYPPLPEETREGRRLLAAIARAAVAEGRVAELEAGIRRLCDEADRLHGFAWPDAYVDVDALRALVGDETPEGTT